ncbi:MAG TPA: hypothetical protein VG713_13910, partial [Pirellulales bacterium]|nr:hypothetical protein [Pirellulales bacterium]
MPRTKQRGRKKGGSNTAGFYHLNTTTRKGWYTSDGPRIVRLCDADGNHVKERADVAAAREAYARYREQVHKAPADQMRLADVCKAYLETLPDGSTKLNRSRALFDFVSGFPPRFMNKKNKATAADRLHKGYGDLPVGKLIFNDVREWCAAHPKWAERGAARSAIQALKRALNWAVEMQLIAKNPIKGYKVRPANKRVTYFTPEQEAAMLLLSKPDFAEALRVCIRTGARFGCEFAKLEARHVEETSRGMQWKFPPHEAKTRKERIIIVAPEIAELVRGKMKQHKSGPLFRNSYGKPWNGISLRHRFDALRDRLESKGIKLDNDACMYSTRHTFAKRTLGGYWTGKPATIEQLAGAMGNTRDVAWGTYGKWCDA